MQKKATDNQEIRKLQLRIERLEQIQKTQFKLMQYASNHTALDLLQKFLDEAEKLTESKIGFYHYYDEDTKTLSLKTWSSNTLDSVCEMVNPNQHYPLSKAGMWVDCIHTRKPVICNDYERNDHKKNLPEGHSPIVRFISIPVFRYNKIVAILGLGNKKDDYTEDDVNTVQQLADLAWETITRKNAEEAILVANNRMSSLLQASPISMGIAQDRTIITTNEKYSKLTGYTIEELVGSSTRMIYESEQEYQRVGHEQYWQIKEYGVCQVDTIFVRKDGRKINARLYSASLDPDHYEAGQSFAVMDVTDQLKNKQQLQRYTDSLNAIFDRVPNILLLTDEDGKIVKINRKGVDFVSKSEDDCIGQYSGNIFSCHNAKRSQCGTNEPCAFCPVKNSIKKVFRSGKVSQQQARLTFLHNSEPISRDLLISTSPLEYDSKKTALISLTDITQIVENERALERQQRAITLTNRIAKTFLTSGSVNIYNDIVSSVLEPLQSEYGYFGYIDENGNLVSTPLLSNFIKDFSVENRTTTYSPDEWKSLWGRSFLDKQSIRTNEEFHLSQKKITLQNVLVVPIIHNQTLIGQFGVANKQDGYDPYDQELLENAANQTAPILNAVLERKQQEKEREVLEIQIMQSQRLESVGRLAGGVAHDLNNMLVPILGYAEMLVDDTEQEDHRYDFANEIVMASTKASSIVRQLLAFSRKQTLETKPLNINSLLRGFEKLLRRTIREDIAIKMFLENNLLPITGDIGQIEQVIMNLAINAQDAMPDGGTLIFETKTVEIDQEYISKHENVLPGKYINLSVSDSGHGMEPAITDQIFEPFFTTKSKYEGSGLGLATAYGIIKQHGGNIWVYSEVDHGTTFKIYLPVHDTVTITSETQQAKADVFTAKTGTILLAEDNLEVLNLTKTILNRNGYKVYTATKGTEALNLCNKHVDEIDLLLTDVIMPDMDGKTLANQISTKYPQMKTIFMSGYSGKIISHRGILDQNTTFIQKPFTARKLLEKIDEIL